jgi:tripartite-type tricarboxylate transporter receptor subunit TctC
MFAKLPFDPDRDLQMIGQTGVTPNLLAVTLSLPVKSVPELIDYAKNNPDKLIFGSNGNGTSVHIAGELFKLLTGTQIVHVPYKGSAQADTDLIGGRVQLIFENVGPILPHIKAGRVRALGVTGGCSTSTTMSGIAFGQAFGHYGLDQETIEWQPVGSPPHNHANRSCAQIMRI